MRKNLIIRHKKLFLFFSIILFLFLISMIRSLFFETSKRTYMTAVVKRGNIEESVLASGIVRPAQLIAINARATGRVISTPVSVMSVVKEGDLLAEIDPTTQENDLKRKKSVLSYHRARLVEQEARLELARKNLVRHKNMGAIRAVSQASLDDAMMQVKAREAQVIQIQEQITQAEIDVENAEVNLSHTRMVAPISGTVLEISLKKGQHIGTARLSQTAIILGDLSKMMVTAKIAEADILKVRAGQPVYLTVLADPKRRYEGRLERIDPAPESIRSDSSINPSSTGNTNALASSAVYYNGFISINNQDHFLRTYMTAQVHIVLGRSKDVFLIPSDALRNETKGRKAWVQVLVDKNKVIAKQVTVGLNNKIMAEIVSGLDEGDVVITGSNDTLMLKPPDEHSEDET